MMNKKQVFEHYSSILNDLLDDSLWFETYFQQPYMLDEDIRGCDWSRIPANLSLCCGATRGCFVDEDYDYVVKFDIDDDDMYGSACAREEELYRRAQTHGLDQYFAEVAYIGTYTRTINFYDLYDIEQAMTWYGYSEDEFDNEFAAHEDDMGTIHPITISIPLYAYRRADHYDMWANTPAQITLAEENEAKRFASPLRSRNLSVAIAFIREYGMEEYRRFSEFGMAEDINDLHCNNIGSIDGHFVLIDYSGYHDSETEYEEESAEWRTGSDEEDED